MIHVQRLCILAGALIFLVSGKALAERAEWQAFETCVGTHQENVARVVVSLEEGAALIVQTLCSGEAADLMNAVAAREMLASAELRDRFDTSRFVVERETRHWLYLEKLRQASGR